MMTKVDDLVEAPPKKSWDLLDKFAMAALPECQRAARMSPGSADRSALDAYEMAMEMMAARDTVIERYAGGSDGDGN